jgi:hypothetical protein
VYLARFERCVDQSSRFSNPLASKAVVSAPLPLSGKTVPSLCSTEVTPACLHASYGIPTTAQTAGMKSSISVNSYINQCAQSVNLMSFLKKERTDMDCSVS